MAKGPKNNSHSVPGALETTTMDSHFAMATNPDTTPNAAFDALVALAGVDGTGFEYAFVTTNASVKGAITIGPSLLALDGIISSGNGKDTVNLSGSTGNNLILTGNGVDTAIGGDGNDRIDTGNGKDSITGGKDTGVFAVVPVLDPLGVQIGTTTTFTVGDVLTGGQGKDSFHYSLGDGVDEITDFRLGQDQLVFHGITQDQLVALTGTGSSSLVIGISDGLGGGQANMAIQVDGVTSLDQLLSSHSLLFV